MRRAGWVTVLSAAGTMAGLDRALRRRGYRVHRIPGIAVRQRPIGPLRARVRAFGPVDTVLLTARPAAAVLRRLLGPGAGGGGRRAAPLELVPAGPETARVARALRLGRVRRPRGDGAAAILAALAGAPPRSILYARSDRAGPGLARRLARDGHRVLDLVAYRVVPGPPLGRPARERLLRSGVVIALSPSSVAGVRRRLDRASFAALAGGRRWIAPGERTLRAIRGHGIRGARRARAASVEALCEAVVSGTDP